jgi:thioredoxin 1
MTTLLKFEASWCAPCKTIEPSLQYAQQQFGDKLEVRHIDIEHDNTLTSQYRVRSVPTLVLLDHEGFEVSRHVGMIQRDALATMLRQVIANPS